MSQRCHMIIFFTFSRIILLFFVHILNDCCAAVLNPTSPINYSDDDSFWADSDNVDKLGDMLLVSLRVALHVLHGNVVLCQCDVLECRQGDMALSYSHCACTTYSPFVPCQPYLAKQADQVAQLNTELGVAQAMTAKAEAANVKMHNERSVMIAQVT